jgi:nicotinamidase-related amidase
MSDAVIVIDMLNDFVTGKLKCDRAKLIIPSLQKLLKAAREKGIPVIYSGDAHTEGDFELTVWGPHAMKGEEGAEVIPELKPEKGDCIVDKTTYSAFYNTNLHKLLQELGVERLIITGIHTNICDRHTAADAFFRGYKITVPKDCVQAFTQKEHEEGLEYLKTVYAAEIKTADELIGEWD